ncbi:hypothetical protein APHAL10511_000522 [Amanita phalloides]|nr:hypothetical protein APHAL10511_000522 [Amanita phalloides]
MTKSDTSTQSPSGENKSKPQHPDGPAQIWQNPRLLAITAVIFLFISEPFVYPQQLPPTHINGIQGLLIGFDNSGMMTPSSESQINTDCGHPLKTIQDWHVRTFRPKWFGLFGGPGTITYRTWSSKARQISVVDLDKRDIEIRMWVDREDRGHNAVELDHTVECGEDVKKCLDSGFGAARILVPPGWHKVTAEIVKRNDFDWGGEWKKRVMWNVQECP